MTVWIPENLEKIYPHTPPPDNGLTAAYAFGASAGAVAGTGRVVYGARKEVELFGAGNECRSFQIAVSLARKGTVGMVVSHLKTKEGQRLSKDCLLVHRVGCVTLDGVPAPDPMFEEREARIGRGIATAFRITVRIPAHLPAGIYGGKIKVQTDEGSENISLRVRVFGFTLPDAFSMGVDFWTFPQFYAKQYGCEVGSDKYWQIVKACAEDLRAHGQSFISLLDISSANPIKWVDWHLGPAGELRFDFSLLDRWVGLHKAAGIDKGMVLGGMARTEFDFLDLKENRRVRLQFPIGSEKYNSYWSQMLTALAGHLRERGWMKGVMIKPSDEISEEFVPQWQAMARLVRECDREFLTTEALGFGRAGLLGYCDLFVMHAWCGMDFIPKIKEAGAEAWWYFSCDCDNPNFFVKNDWIEMRAIPWMTWQRQLGGVLRWSYSYWNADPFKDVHCGMHQFPAGDCHMVYPGPGGPISSVRWEIFREGVQDYEYIKMFHDGLGRLPAEKREAIEKQARARIQRVTGLVTYSRKYANYHAAQMFLGEQIESFTKGK